MKTPHRIDKSLFTDELINEFDNKVNVGDAIEWNSIINKPQLADSSWKSPVATFEDLPMEGNTTSDVRLVITSGDVYKWSGTVWEFIGANDTSVDWSHLQNKPTTFPPSSHEHTYASITSKPSTFPPSVHTHVESEIVDLDKYTQDEVNTLLSGKSDSSHTHIELHMHDNKTLLDSINSTRVSAWDTVNNKADLAYVDNALANKSDTTHLHDGRYYTQSQIATFLSGKSDTSHLHDDRYYTETEVNNFLSAKQDNIVSGTHIKTVNGVNIVGTGDAYVETGLDDIAVLNNITQIKKDPTGFTNPAGITVSYDSVTRRVTLTGDVEAYCRGQLIPELVSGWVSEPHADVQGTYFLKYCDGAFQFTTAPWEYFDLMIAFIQYNSHSLGIREVHGLMPWTVHKEFHETLGTYREMGGLLTAGSFTLNSTTLLDRRPLVDSVLVHDEDLPTTVPALTTRLYTHRYLTGSGVRTLNPDQTEILPVVGSTPYWNQWNGTTWVQTPFTNNDYGAVFLVALPTTSDVSSQKFRFMWVQPQQVSSVLSTIQGITPNSLVHGDVSSLASEFCFIGKIIIRFQGGNWTIVQTDLITGTRASQVMSTGMAGGVTSFNARTGDVIPIAGDYTGAQITQDASHRFVTDIEKNTWNAKASTAVATTSVNGLMSSTDKTKLDGVATNANNYVHPATHPATMITEDTSHRFVTDTEKSTWNGKQDALGFTPENITNKGQPNGYAGLDVTGKVPSNQLPSFVDDVLEYANFASLPATGENGKIYITIDDNKTFRWSGTVYVEISASIALGTTSTTAYRGDHGLIAYNHSQTAHAPANAQKNSDITKAEIEAKLIGDITSHTHSLYVTQDQLGSAGYGDMVKATYDTNNDGKVNSADSADSVPWTGVTGKPSTFTPSAHFHTISDTTGLQTALDGKLSSSHDGATGSAHGVVTTSVNGFMIASDKSKLDGIATNANNYTHPATHPPSIIVQDTSNRFVTDAEKSAWNGKAETTVATTSVNGLMSSTDKTKLDGVAINANNYVHPTTDGNLHVPATSTTNNGKVLKAGATAGSIAWGTLAKADVGLSNVDNTSDMAKPVSTAQQTALNTKAESDHVHGNLTNDGKIGVTANLIIKTGTGGSLETLTAGTTSQYLRGDGSWSTPPNTEYTEISEAEISAGIATTLRTITARRAKYIQDNTPRYHAGTTAPTNTMLLWIDTN